MVQDMLEKYSTGVGYLPLGENMIKTLKLEDTFKKNMDSITAGFKTNDGVDQDDRVRKYRWNIVEPIWDAYVGGKISSKGFESAIHYVDYKIAVAGRETQPEGLGITVAKDVGTFLVPGLPFILAGRDLSYIVANDTAAEALKEVKPEDLYAAIIEYDRLIKNGATNGDHQVGDKPWGLFAKHAGMSVGQALILTSLIDGAFGSKGGGYGGGNGEGGFGGQ